MIYIFLIGATIVFLPGIVAFILVIAYLWNSIFKDPEEDYDDFD